MIILDAVNTSLRYLGEMPVPSTVDIDSLDELHEAKIVRNTLLQVSKEYQAKGWWFNRENWTLVPDSTTGRIGVPVTALSLRGVNGGVITRGSTLYNLNDKTYTFTDGVECVVVWEIPFEDLPESFAELVTYTTARDTQSFLRGDVSTDARLTAKVQESYLKVQREDIAFNQYNFISGTRLVDRTTRPTPVT